MLALLFCTTHLHYTQNMMENNYILLLTLAGFAFQYEWLRTGSRRALLIGSAALGLNLLTRLTTGLDLLAAASFLLLVSWFERVRGRELWERFVVYAKTAVPVYAVFLLIDRLYQYYRFGSFFNTYVHYFTVEHRLQDPSLPASYPFENAIPRRLSGRALCAGEVHLSFRSFAGAHDCHCRAGLEALSAGDRGVPRRRILAASWRTSAFTQSTRCGVAISPGATATFPRRRNWWHLSQCLCFCVIASNWGGSCGGLGWR